MNGRRIYLIGFMGAGKSHTGRRLAQLLDLPFLDLDHAIEAAAGRTITEIFTQEGEAAFRERERTALHTTAQYGSGIFATGGGLPCFFDNLEWMGQHGIRIYLQVPPAILLQRLERGKDQRPLLRDRSHEELLAYIHEKLGERGPYYEQADVIYQVSEPNEDVAGALHARLLQIIGH